MSEKEDYIQGIDGYTICVAKNILQQVRSVYVDYTVPEFRITTERSFSALRSNGCCC